MRVTTILTTIVCVALIAGCAGPSSTMQQSSLDTIINRSNQSWQTSPAVQNGAKAAFAALEKLKLDTSHTMQITIINSSESIYLGLSFRDKNGKIKKDPVMTINSGFFANVTIKEDEIAAIIARHLAYLSLGHIREDTPLERVFTGVTLGAAVALGAAVPGSHSLAGSVAGLITLPAERRKEEEADRLGYTYLTQAGYNGEAMLSMFEKLKKASAKIPGYSTNAWPPNRSTYLKELSAEANANVQD